jgi:hypothetical protein
MHIGGGLHRRGSRVQVRHVAEVLASGESPSPKRADVAAPGTSGDARE